MNIKQKLTSAAVIGAMMATVVAPASFAATVKIKRNGAGSTNRAAVVKLNRQTATQDNSTRAGVFVGLSSNTGGNTANNNTGDGVVNTDSGNVTSTVTTTIEGSTNTGAAPDCGCANGNGNITIARNGAGSDNAALIVIASSTEVSQTNSTGALVGVMISSNTGENKANGNTGGGEVSTNSGNVTNTVTTTVGGSTNN